jgi:hypothetical protein
MNKIIFCFCIFFISCNKEREIFIRNKVYIERDSIDDVNIIIQKKSESSSAYIVVGDVKWVAVKDSYVFGYKEAYITRTFLETNSSFFFFFDTRIIELEDMRVAKFPTERTFEEHLKSYGCYEPYRYLALPE